MATLRATGFDLQNTLECGQFFQWARIDGGYRVRTHGRVFEARQEGERLSVAGVDAAFARKFFALDHEAGAIERSLRRDPIVRRAMESVPGIRILRQDPYECTLGFIVSICSNIPRITGNVESIARRYGRKGLLPGPGVRLGEKTLRGLGVGFRARYLVSAQENAALLKRIPEQSDVEARETLMQIDGIAEKVADCILLYAYGRLSVFPVDTWIRQAMRRLYFGGQRVLDREIRALAAERFGPGAGYAQQYLFAWSRRHLKDRRIDAPSAVQ